MRGGLDAQTLLAELVETTVGSAVDQGKEESGEEDPRHRAEPGGQGKMWRQEKREVTRSGLCLNLSSVLGRGARLLSRKSRKKLPP